MSAQELKTEQRTEAQKAHVQLRTLLSDSSGVKAMEETLGGNYSGVAACALGALANELLMLSHYCGTTNDSESALLMLEDVLLSMSHRASGAASLAIAELCVAREKAEAAQ